MGYLRIRYDFGSHPLQLDRTGGGDGWSLADLTELGSKSFQGEDPEQRVSVSTTVRVGNTISNIF